MPLFSSRVDNPREIAKQIGGGTVRYISTYTEENESCSGRELYLETQAGWREINITLPSQL